MGQGRSSTVGGAVHHKSSFLSCFILTAALKLASVHDSRSVRFALALLMYLHRKQKSYTLFWGYIALKSLFDTWKHSYVLLNASPSHMR